MHDQVLVVECWCHVVCVLLVCCERGERRGWRDRKKNAPQSRLLFVLRRLLSLLVFDGWTSTTRHWRRGAHVFSSRSAVVVASACSATDFAGCLPAAVPLLCLCVPRGGALADSAAAERVVAVPFVMPWRACVWLPGQVPLTFFFVFVGSRSVHSLAH